MEPPLHPAHSKLRACAELNAFHIVHRYKHTQRSIVHDYLPSFLPARQLVIGPVDAQTEFYSGRSQHQTMCQGDIPCLQYR